MFYMQVRLDLSFKYIGIPETPLPGMNFIAINVLERVITLYFNTESEAVEDKDGEQAVEEPVRYKALFR